MIDEDDMSLDNTPAQQQQQQPDHGEEPDDDPAQQQQQQSDDPLGLGADVDDGTGLGEQEAEEAATAPKKIPFEPATDDINPRATRALPLVR